jgi:Uma2 family endonuclease
MATTTHDVLVRAAGGLVYLPPVLDVDAFLADFNDPVAYRCDIEGEVLIWMPPAFPPCSELAFELMASLREHIRARRLPIRRFGADAGFLLDPDPAAPPHGRRVTPDGALVRAERITPELEQAEHGFWPIVPDLCLEVLSPTDHGELSDRKLALYRRARVPRLWVVDPQQRTVVVWRSGRVEATLTEPTDTLELGELVPGWRMALGDLFAPGGPA